MKEQWKKEMQQKMADYQESDIEVSWTEIEKALAANRKQAKVVPLWFRRVAAAAAIILVAGVGYWTVIHNQAGTDETSMTNAVQIPSAPTPISNIPQPDIHIQEMVTRVLQSVRRSIVSGIKESAPMVAEESKILDNAYAESEPAEEMPETNEQNDSRTHQEVMPSHSSTIYPSNLSKSASSQNRLTAKVYLSNTMASSSQYNSSSYQIELPGQMIQNDPPGNGQDVKDGIDGQDGANSVNGKNGNDGVVDQNKPDNKVIYKTVQTSESVRHHQPIRFGISLRYRMSRHWNMESGLTYTRLSADIANTVDEKVTATEQSLNYIGIPLSASYLLWDNRYFNLYISAGGLVEKMVKGSRTTQGETNSVSIHPLQISVNGVVGAEFKLNDDFSFYAEPALNYYFDNGSSIPTLYQEKPLNFNLNVGIRFNIK